jgi:hypothetical protein
MKFSLWTIIFLDYLYQAMIYGKVVNYNGAFTLDVKSILNENLGGILGGTQC